MVEAKRINGHIALIYSGEMTIQERFNQVTSLTVPGLSNPDFTAEENINIKQKAESDSKTLGKVLNHLKRYKQRA